MAWPDAIRNILIVRPSALGDVCRTVPVLVSLKRRFPDARIDWLVQSSFRAAIEHHPDLGRVVEFPRHRLRAWWTPGAWITLFGLIADLRRERYDLVLDCQGLLRSGLLALASGARRRVGLADAEELGWLFVNTRVQAPKGSTHAVERMLALAESAGAAGVRDMRLYTGEVDKRFARQTVGEATRYVVVAPTTRWAGKLWSMERHAELLRRLLDDASLGLTRAVIIGTPDEREQCRRLLEMTRGDHRVLDLVGKTSVGQAMALIEGAALVIGCDSAAVHMAVGFDRPMVALYGPTRVDLVGPYARESCVLQHVGAGDRLDHKDAPTGQALMARIGVDEAVELARAQARALSKQVPGISKATSQTR